MRDEHSRTRFHELVAEYRKRTDQPDLSTRRLAEQMRAAGVMVSHGTLQNMLNGTTTPDRSTLRGLASFFGVSEYHFDFAERPASIMGRIGRLDSQGLDAVERLLADLDTPGPNSAGPDSTGGDGDRNPGSGVNR